MNNDYLASILLNWGVGTPSHTEKLPNGHFNETTRVQTASGAYVLRIYETENDLAKIKREQRLLSELDGQSLSFALPVFRNDCQDEPIVFLPDSGRHAVLMPLLPGRHTLLHDSAELEAAGSALAELTEALARLAPPLEEERNVSYLEWRGFHPSVSDIGAMVEGLPVSDEQKQQMKGYLSSLTLPLDSLYASLPKQWIHGDYTVGNRLIEGGRITGILDFEFSCFDVRAMDLAIAIGGGPSALWEHGEGWSPVEAIARGYLRQVPLTELELRQLPVLIRLRRAAMLVTFYGRYCEGLDSERWMSGIVHWVLEADRWLTVHGDELIARLSAIAEQAAHADL